jgi:signal transduction histidine kinase/CheY-like chemotaxis protein
MRPRSIRTQITLLAIVPTTLIALVLASYFTFSRLGDAERAIVQLGEGAALHLAEEAEFSLVTGNQALLERLLVVTTKETNVEFAQVRDVQGNLMGSIGNVPAKPAIVGILGQGMVRSEHVLLFTAPILRRPVLMDDPYFAEAVPAEPRKIGWAVVGISAKDLEEGRDQMLMGGLTITLLVLLASTAIALTLGQRLAGPLHSLANMVAELGRGNLGARTQTDAQGELLQLQKGVNEMAVSLQQARDDLQQRIQEATAHLAAQKEAAEQANADKSRFLAATSHDLRQPMHALGLFAAALKEKVTVQEQLDLVRKIEDSILALESMFNMLLDVSKLDAGIISAQPQVVLLQPLLGRLAQEWGGQADEKGLRFRVRASRLAVRSDPILLTRILNNLVKNAIRYTTEGGVLVAARRRGDKAVIEVWDTGIGIPPAYRARIFEEFYQVDNPERNRARGLGLGLFIVQRLCQLLDHPVQVRSQPGRGSVFSIVLPAVQGYAGQPAEHREVTRFDQEWVLLLEDDEQVLAAMRILLEGWGLKVRAAVDLKGALSNLPDLGGPALILSDYRLGGGISGIEAIARLRELFGRAVPAILISGDTSEEGMADMQQSGLPLLHKPVRPAKLRALVNHLIAREGNPLPSTEAQTSSQNLDRMNGYDRNTGAPWRPDFPGSPALPAMPGMGDSHGD